MPLRSKRRHRQLQAREVAVGAVVCAIVAGVILVGGLGGETLARVDRQVTVTWRPAYDLLVLPRGVDVTLRVGGQRVAEANFMAALNGGISVEQWQDVLDVPGVDVAAPIAPIGYFRRPTSQYHFPQVEPGFFGVERVVRWNNGADTRVQGAVTQEDFERTAGPKAATRNLAGCSGFSQLHLTPKGTVTTDRGARLARRDDQLTGFFTDELRLYAEDDSSWRCLGLDPGGVFSVYGIDPTQEARLVGVDDAVINGEYLDPEQSLGSGPASSFCSSGKNSRCKPLLSIPMLMSQQGWVDTRFRIRLLRYDVADLPMGALSSESRCGLESAVAVPRCTRSVVRRQFRQTPSPEVVDALLPLDDTLTSGPVNYEDGKWRAKELLFVADQNYLARPSPIRYRSLDDFPEGPWLGAVAAVPTGSYGPEPTFRTQLPPARFPIIRYDVKGTFDGRKVAERFDRRENWLPEDTYRPPYATLHFDESGTRVPARELRPTANPLGYLLEPPRALVSLPTASLLAGDRPIGAIRVRVAGVDEPGEQAWTRVENAARRIEESTGLRSLVTLGGSPARVLVRVPGVSLQDQPTGRQTWRLPNYASYTLQGKGRYSPALPARSAEGFGWVEEPWLKQGAAIEYLRAGAAQHLYIVLILICAAAVYLVAAFTSLGLADVKANAIRRAVGWSRASVFRREMGRAIKVGSIGSVVGILAGTLTASILSFPLSIPIAVVGAAVGLVLCTAAAVLPAWKSGGMQLAPILSGGEIALTGERRRRGRHRPATGILNLALRQLGRLKARAALAMTGGIIATGSLMLIVGLQQRFSGSLQITILGQQILLETGVLQIAVAIVALVLAFALIGEILYQTVMDRAAEIATFRAMGWRKSQVARLMIWQGGVLGIGCALLGVLTWGLVLVLTLGVDAWAIVASGALSAVVGGGILGLAAAGLPAWRAASKRPVEAAGTT